MINALSWLFVSVSSLNIRCTSQLKCDWMTAWRMLVAAAVSCKSWRTHCIYTSSLINLDGFCDKYENGESFNYIVGLYFIPYTGWLPKSGHSVWSSLVPYNARTISTTIMIFWHTSVPCYAEHRHISLVYFHQIHKVATTIERWTSNIAT